MEQMRVKRTKDFAMLKEFDDSVHEEASRFTIKLGAFVHGIAPVPAGLIPLIPFYLVADFELAVILALIFTLTLLFLTGFQMGHSARASGIVYGFRLLFAGIVTATIILVLGIGH